MLRRPLQPGDLVIFRMSKHTTHPGPRAEDIIPEPRGDFYQYEVDKFWAVDRILDDGQLLLVTRRGKQHRVAADNPRLRRPSWWERLRYGRRFPTRASRNAVRPV